MDSTIIDCKLNQNVVIVVLFDDREEPVADVVVELERDGKVTRGRTDSGGRCRFGKLPHTDYQLSLPELDGAAWELVTSLPLDPVPKNVPGSTWAAAKPSRAYVPDEHEVRSGECMAGIAIHYGFSPGSIQALAENRARLRDRRGDLLEPGDRVKLPPRMPRKVAVRAGETSFVHRIGVPFALTLRRIDACGRPILGQSYLLELEGSSGPLPSREGATDSDGFLVELVPPDATGGQVTFKAEPAPVRFKLRFSTLPPITTAAGVTARLRHLGYRCSSRELDAEARKALARFQVDVALPPTGRADGPTLRALEELHLS